MRTIKFRVWVNNEYMAIQGTPDLETLQSFMFHYGDSDFMMEYTGIIDKNNFEICEGDILRFRNDLGRNHIYKIWREEGGLVYNMFDNDIDKHISQIDFYYGCSDMQSKQWLKQCEVIGNIYENPELLSTPTAVL